MSVSRQEYIYDIHCECLRLGSKYGKAAKDLMFLQKLRIRFVTTNLARKTTYLGIFDVTLPETNSLPLKMDGWFED